MPGDSRVGTTFSGYTIEKQLGRGGMAVVYLARDSRLGRLVALKVLPSDLSDDARFRDRFIRESQTAASLDHPNVIPIYEAGEFEGTLFIAMRYVDGVDLAGMIADDGPLPVAKAIALMAQVSGALDAAHARGLIHRDVKPANILIARRAGADGTDHAYLVDFGLAKTNTSNTGLTQTGQFVGTLDYIAPEQIEGKQIDGRADGYALGCLFYACLSGHPPFNRESGVSMMYAHLLEPPPSLAAVRPDIAAALDPVIARAMAKAPGDRFASGAEMVNAARLALSQPHATGAPATDGATVITSSPAPVRPPLVLPPLPPAAPPQATAAAASERTQADSVPGFAAPSTGRPSAPKPGDASPPKPMVMPLAMPRPVPVPPSAPMAATTPAATAPPLLPMTPPKTARPPIGAPAVPRTGPPPAANRGRSRRTLVGVGVLVVVVAAGATVAVLTRGHGSNTAVTTSPAGATSASARASAPVHASELPLASLTSANPPPPRAGFALGFDPVTGDLILEGGAAFSSGPNFNPAKTLNDTWRWNGKTWKELPVSNTSANPTLGMASLGLDGATNRLLLVDGNDGESSTGTYTWSGTTWVPYGASLSGIVSEPNVAWDPASRQLIVTGDDEPVEPWQATSVPPFQGDPMDAEKLASGSHQFVSIINQNLTYLSGAALAYDPISHDMVEFGGFSNEVTVVWTGTEWEEQFTTTVPPAGYAVAATDPTLNSIVMVAQPDVNADGVNFARASTWTWDGQNWVRHVVTKAPPEDGYKQLVWDPVLKQLILVEMDPTAGTTMWAFVSVTDGWRQIPG